MLLTYQAAKAKVTYDQRKVVLKELEISNSYVIPISECHKKIYNYRKGLWSGEIRNVHFHSSQKKLFLSLRRCNWNLQSCWLQGKISPEVVGKQKATFNVNQVSKSSRKCRLSCSEKI